MSTSTALKIIAILCFVVAALHLEPTAIANVRFASLGLVFLTLSLLP